MGKPVLLIVSVGELGTNVLEAAARSGLFSHIVIAGRCASKALERANSALIGAGLEGHYPSVSAEQLDVDKAEFVTKIRQINPDFIFTTATLMPWWQIEKSTAPKLPFGGYVSLHLALMQSFRDRLDQANLSAIWIGASYPDVVNPVLHRSGSGPICGIGNVQEPIPKVISGLSQRLGVPNTEISVRLVAQHAFEYHVFSEFPSKDLPPFLLHAEVNGDDVTDLALKELFKPFPFKFDLFFNRVTASAAIQAFKGFLAKEPTAMHLPGVNGLIGGYPVVLKDGLAELDLHKEWTEADAIDTNVRSLPWEGIECIESDGSITITEVTQSAFKTLLGKSVQGVTLDTSMDQAHQLLKAL
jgi:hypothetical protein